MVNILVPSAGNRYAHLEYLKNVEGVKKVVTTDIYEDSPGIFAADSAYNVPRVDSSDYLPAIKEICKEENIDMIIPMMDLDIMKFSENRDIFEKEDIIVFLSSKPTIRISNDQYKSYTHLNENNIPVAKTVLAANWENFSDQLGFPVIVKPRFANTPSKNYIIKKAGTEDELKKIIKDVISIKLEHCVIQEYLDGTEITVDFFCDEEGEPVSVVPGERTEALSAAFSEHGGAISKGKIIKDKEITELVSDAARTMDFFGPANVQGFRTLEGEFLITEINPRLTGATKMTKAAGQNYFEWSVQLANRDLGEIEDSFDEIQMTTWMHPIFFKQSNLLSTENNHEK